MALGLCLLYFALAVACLGINEAVAQRLGLRAEFLWKAVSGLLGGSAGAAFAKKLYDNHLIAALTEEPTDPTSIPSYIPGHLFAEALLDELALKPTTDGRVPDISQIENFPGLPATAHAALLALAKGHEQTFEDFKAKVEAWFNAAADRTSGWYKRRMKMWSIYIAAVVVCTTNADTLTIGSALWNQPSQRAALSKRALDADANKQALDHPSSALLKSADLQAVLGWHGPWPGKPGYNTTDTQRIPMPNASEILLKLLGLIITISMVSMGAPFWFDVLSKFGSVTSAGKKPAASPDQEKKS